VPGEPALEVEAQLAASIPGVGVAVVFPTRPLPLVQLAERLAQRSAAAPAPAHEAPQAEGEEEEQAAEAPARNPLMSARLAAMSVAEKMQLALSGDREARAYLLRDTNKVLHAYVLRNPRIGLDEVLYAAKLPTLSPEALKLIAEHRDWGASLPVLAALARNPKTPLPLALKLLPRLPLQDLRVIAKGNARQALVQAARKLLVSPPAGGRG
jgi:hypothetical protein